MRARQPRRAPALRAAHVLRPGARRDRALRRAERDPAAGRAALHGRRPRVPDALRRPALDRGRQLHGVRRGARAQRAARARQRPAARDPRRSCPASGSWRRPCGASRRPSGRRWWRCWCPRARSSGSRRPPAAADATRAGRARRSTPGSPGRALPRAASPWWRRRRGPRLSRRSRTTRSELAVPILSGDEVVAVLNVESDRPGAFDRGQVITLETLADGIGILLRNAELYAALEQTNAQLVELDRTKSELVNIVAHDFRAPLAGDAGLRGAAGVAARRAADEEQLEQARGDHPGRHPHGEAGGQDARRPRGWRPASSRSSSRSWTCRRVIARGRQRSSDGPRAPARARAARGAAAGLGGPRAHGRGGREPALERGQVLAGRAARCASRCGASASWRRVSVSDHGIGIAAEDLDQAVPAVLAPARPQARRRSRAPAWASTSASASCAPTAGASRWRARSARARPSASPCRSSARRRRREPPVIVVGGAPTTARAARCGASRRTWGSPCTRSRTASRRSRRPRGCAPAALVLERILPRLRADEVAERLQAQETTRAVPILLLGAADGSAFKAGLFRECLPHPLDRRMLQTALERLGAPVH